MNNEIKEILDRAKNLKYKCDCCEEISPGKYIMRNDKQIDNLIEAVYIIDKLLDYITNLQEENEKNKEYSEFYKDMSDKWKEMSDVFKKSCEDYKSKIDKAIEEINYMITNADITEISAIKLKQILGDKGENNE